MEPRSIAIVGASKTGTGLIAVQNLRSLGYVGEVACINAKYDNVLGYPCYPRLEYVPFVPDAVIVAVGRERVVEVLEDAALKGVRGAVVFAIGFAESDEFGKDLQARLVSIADKAAMAVIGPNCQGAINFSRATPIYTDVVTPYKPGHVGLLAQSGSILTALINNRRGVRWSHAVSSGNEAVVDSADILRYYIDNPDVTVICAFLEVIRRPADFFDQCDRAFEAGKPVIICKAGRTAAAQAAVTAHSGALAAPDRLIDALLRRHQAMRVETLEELLETAIAMQSPRRPRGRGMAVVSASGGHIELAYDNLGATDLTTPEFAPQTQAALTEVLAPFLQPKNPLDWWGTANPEDVLPRILRTVAADANIDIVAQVADFTVGPTGQDTRAARPLRAAKTVLSDCQELFVVLDGIGGAPQAQDTETALADGIIVLSGLQAGLRALGHLVEYQLRRSGNRQLLSPAGSAEDHAALTFSPGHLPGAFSLLAASGFSLARGGIARTIQDAVNIGNELGFPVVAKIANERVTHKSDIGGVSLDLRTAAELSDAVERLLRSGAAQVLVQEQIAGDVEMFLGLQSVPSLGTFVLIGLGGIWTELIDDVQIRPVGLRIGEAEQMLQQLKGYRRLLGARDSTPVNLDVIVDAVRRLDALGQAAGDQIQSLDVNPLIVDGDRAIVVDALLVKVADEHK
jgi:acyl-CoA synthetase (NDP forming)